jgi:hypothetical protein
MRRFVLLFCVILLFFQSAPTYSNGAEAITLTLPESVISSAVTALLPFKIDAHSKTIDGDITVINITDLQFTKDHLACRLHLAGNNLAFLTEIAGHEIKLKVGAIEVDFQTDAAVRFDAQKQILYIKPVINDMAAKGDGANAEIGQALVAILNGKEFPISMKKLDPLIAEAGHKTVTIDTQISDIKAKADMLLLRLTPIITAQ